MILFVTGTKLISYHIRMRHDDPAIMMILCQNALGIRALKGYQMYHRSSKNNIQVNLSNAILNLENLKQNYLKSSDYTFKL